MKLPPEYHEAACCLNCEHFNYNHYNNCMKYQTTIDFSMICADYKKESVRMVKSDYKLGSQNDS